MDDDQNSKSEALKKLRELIDGHRGAQRLTAKKYGSSSNWIWIVLHERVVASPSVIRKITDCAIEAIEELQSKKEALNIRLQELTRKIENIGEDQQPDSVHEPAPSPGFSWLEYDEQQSNIYGQLQRLTQRMKEVEQQMPKILDGIITTMNEMRAHFEALPPADDKEKESAPRRYTWRERLKILLTGRV